MANVLAAATGNWSATATWTGGVLPTSADTVYSNGFTVAIDQNVTVVELRADANGVATAGGGFTVAAASGVTRNITAKLTNSSVAFSPSAGGTINVVGDVTSSSRNAFSLAGTGAVYITGNLLFQNATSITVDTAITLYITGNVTNSSTAVALVNNTAAPTITIVGNVSTAVTGGINILGAGTLNVIGSVTGGSASTGLGCYSYSGSMNVTRAIGGSSLGAFGVAQNNASVVYVEEIEYGSSGQSPTSGLIRLSDKTNNKCVFFRQGLSKKTVSDIAGLGVLPAVADVRSGVSYNAGQLTGTCAVPSAGSVALGVAVDATTGTAILTSAQIQTACASALTAFAGGRLADVATTATTGQQINDATW